MVDHSIALQCCTDREFLGNLALSRALGDFGFKKNYALGPQKQIITADPDVTIHDITDEDEFLVLACDGKLAKILSTTWCLFSSGIWDCLSSQQVIDFVRLKVSEGVELKDIAELMCEHCLAPDTSSKTGIGCDNMTVLIVAILHGKTKQEWYDWVTDRVKNHYGYATPDVIPQIYSQERLSSYRARREAMEERDRLRKERGEDGSSNSMFGGNSAFSGFARVLGSTGGISFHPGSGIMSDSGRLMFADNDDDDDDSSDEMDTTGLGGRSFFADALGQHPRTQSTDGGASLRARLAALQDDDDEFDDEDSDKGYVPSTAHIEEIQDDEVTSPFAPVKSDVPKSPSPSPSPTNSRINGDITPVQQFKSPPLENLDPALKVDDMMDSSQDHRKA